MVWAVSRLFQLVLIFVLIWGGSFLLGICLGFLDGENISFDLVHDLKCAPAEERWSLFLLLLLLGIGFDRPVVSCPDDSGLLPSLSLTGVFLWDSYIGLAIDVVPILSSIVALLYSNPRLVAHLS